jgi:hypothetical protein
MGGRLPQKLRSRTTESMGQMVTFGRILLQHHPTYVHWHVTLQSLYSFDPLSFVEIAFGDSRAPMVQDWIQQSQDILRELKDHLQRA